MNPAALFDDSGKTVVVTCGSRGIKLMIAHGFLAAEATVITVPARPSVREGGSGVERTDVRRRRKDEKPKAKVAVLFRNDDFGKDLLGGFKEAVADSGAKVVAAESYEVTDPSVARTRVLPRARRDGRRRVGRSPSRRELCEVGEPGLVSP
ncbi:hypothetical protein [Streptomyces sp. NPDC014995]|uniref:hypothetical protein n=1 Tax=Streptomyces sp. NPDC014995 TaxID=3364936 RepID=UPI0036F88DC7